MKKDKLASVKFKSNGKSYYFVTNLNLNKNDHVIVETSRGIELGFVCDDLKSIEEFKLKSELKSISRMATKDDIVSSKKNIEDAKNALVRCKKIIAKHNSDMKLTDCEYTFDRSKIIFMYTSDERVDFRSLLKELASTFKCRIELRQIGPRDKAKAVGGLGVCGLPLCCSTFLGDFNGVSINMAKNQMLAINIDKLSGMCGRLMCCLKYEDEYYTKAKKMFPKTGSFIKYNNNRCKVLGINVLNNTLKIDNSGVIEFISFQDNNQNEEIN